MGKKDFLDWRGYFFEIRRARRLCRFWVPYAVVKRLWAHRLHAIEKIKKSGVYFFDGSCETVHSVARIRLLFFILLGKRRV